VILESDVGAKGSAMQYYSWVDGHISCIVLFTVEFPRCIGRIAN